jgi:hypothetical protein
MEPKCRTNEAPNKQPPTFSFFFKISLFLCLVNAKIKTNNKNDNKMETVVSGIRPTGNLHLGNYFGALKNFIKMQNEYNCYFFIADYHSLTTHPHPDDLHGNVKSILVDYLAAGLDPEK